MIQHIIQQHPHTGVAVWILLLIGAAIIFGKATDGQG